jgi:hypothetical protein
MDDTTLELLTFLLEPQHPILEMPRGCGIDEEKCGHVDEQIL